MLLLQRHSALCCVVIFITAVLADNGRYGYADADLNLGNLGTVISERVAQQMSGLTAQLNRHIAGLNSKLQRQMSQLNRQLQRNMQTISRSFNDNLHGLTETIEQHVHQSLEPVRALTIRAAMAQGIGGVTIVLYGGGIQHIVIDGNPYTCAGSMVQDAASPAGIKCTTSLDFHPADLHDVCTDSSYARVNNLYCFGGFASFVCVDTACHCRGGVLHTLDHLREACGFEYGTEQYVKYDYYPNLQNANHIPVPHPNKYVTCENAGKDHCVWHGSGFVLATSEYIAHDMNL